MPVPLPTRFTLTATLPTVRSSASSRCKLPAAATVKVPTVVSRWFTPSAITVPAFRRSPKAVMSWSGSLAALTKASASMMLVPAVMLTAPAAKLTSPTVTLVPAFKRAAAPVPLLDIVLLALISSAPAVASASMLAVPGAAPVTDKSAPAVKVKLSPASTVRLPVAVARSALTVMLLPAFIACTSTLPVPWALRATPSVLPSSSVSWPAVLRSTMAPLLPVVRTSD